MRLVLIEWNDAEGGVRVGWRPVAQMSSATTPCKSVGWLKEAGDPGYDEEVLIIIPHLGDHENKDGVLGDGELRIPAGWPVRIVDLIEKPKRKR